MSYTIKYDTSKKRGQFYEEYHPTISKKNIRKKNIRQTYGKIMTYPKTKI